MCMAIRNTIIERHICTSEWAVSNLLPSNGARSRIPREALLLPPGRAGGVGGGQAKQRGPGAKPAWGIHAALEIMRVETVRQTTGGGPGGGPGGRTAIHAVVETTAVCVDRDTALRSPSVDDELNAYMSMSLTICG